MNVSDLSVLYIYDKLHHSSQVIEVLNKQVKIVSTASSLEEAKTLYQKESPCLILLQSSFNNDIFINFLKTIREVDLKTAFIVITANKNNIYVDDLMELYLTKYITSSFKNIVLEEALYKCMEIISKRVFSNTKVAEDMFFNFHTQSIIKNKKSYVLNKKQSLLIDLFIQNPNKILSYEEIKYHIWQEDVSEAAFKTLFRDLRKVTYKTIIKNYSGLGYKLNI